MNKLRYLFFIVIVIFFMLSNYLLVNNTWLLNSSSNDVSISYKAKLIEKMPYFQLISLNIKPLWKKNDNGKLITTNIISIVKPQSHLWTFEKSIPSFRGKKFNEQVNFILNKYNLDEVNSYDLSPNGESIELLYSLESDISELSQEETQFQVYYIHLVKVPFMPIYGYWIKNELVDISRIITKEDL